MDAKDPLQRENSPAPAPDSVQPPAPLPPLLIGRRLRGLWDGLLRTNRSILAGVLGLAVGGGGTFALKPGAHPSVVVSPGSAVVPLKQTMVPVVVDSCQYWLFMMGEPTNANFTASLTHSGSCTNWMAHQAYMR